MGIKILLAFLVFGSGIADSVLLSQNCFKDFSIQTKIEFPGCSDNGRIQVGRVEGGIGPYRFFLAGQSNTTGEFIGLAAAEYLLFVTDAENCKDSLWISLVPNTRRNLFSAPNAFSPNGDGVNDRWIVDGVENRRGVSISIFNKWGQEVFNSPDYKNDYAWNGKNGNAKLPEATYFFVISVLHDCHVYNQSGTVTIVR